MNGHLEDRLHALADDVSAPPGDDIRAAVSRRTGVLRRRRQVRRAVGGGLAVAVVVAAGLALRGVRDGSDVDTGPVAPGVDESGLPAWTFEHDGWEVTHAGEHQASADPLEGTGLDGDPVTQVFRAEEDPLGPAVVVSHWSTSDAYVATDVSEEVPIGSTTGSLAELPHQRFVLSWQPSNSDTMASVESFGLSREEVVAFANGLRPYDEEISYPASVDDRFGFTSSYQPQGITEVPQPAIAEWSERQVNVQNGNPAVTILIDGRGSAVFDLEVARLLVVSDSAEQVRVGEHVAYVFEGGADHPATILWEQSGAMVSVEIDTSTELTVDEVVGGLRELTPGQWQVLVEALADGRATEFDLDGD